MKKHQIEMEIVRLLCDLEAYEEMQDLKKVEEIKLKIDKLEKQLNK